METNFEHYKEDFLQILQNYGEVKFAVIENHTIRYCPNGPCHECIFRNNCRNDLKLDWLNSEYKEPLPDLEIDHKVRVKMNYQNEWYPRHFKRWTEDGRIECWDMGLTSFTTDRTATWDEWEDAE